MVKSYHVHGCTNNVQYHCHVKIPTERYGNTRNDVLWELIPLLNIIFTIISIKTIILNEEIEIYIFHILV